jgi:hypothetical protein
MLSPEKIVDCPPFSETGAGEASTRTWRSGAERGCRYALPPKSAWVSKLPKNGLLRSATAWFGGLLPLSGPTKGGRNLFVEFASPGLERAL